VLCAYDALDPVFTWLFSVHCAMILDPFEVQWFFLSLSLSRFLSPFLSLSLSFPAFLCCSLSAYVSWLVLPASCMHAVNLDQSLAWIALCFCSVSRSFGFLCS
jgi:hypothetical protein